MHAYNFPSNKKVAESFKCLIAHQLKFISRNVIDTQLGVRPFRCKHIKHVATFSKKGTWTYKPVNENQTRTKTTKLWLANPQAQSTNINHLHQCIDLTNRSLPWFHAEHNDVSFEKGPAASMWLVMGKEQVQFKHVQSPLGHNV